LKALHHGVARRVKVLRRVLVLGTVTATDMTAFAAQAQMHPVVSHSQAFLAAFWRTRLNVFDV
jgi:hypothetical protein